MYFDINRLCFCSCVLFLLMAVEVRGQETAEAAAEGDLAAQAGRFFGTVLSVNDDALTSKEIIDQLGEQLKPPADGMDPQRYLGFAQPIIMNNVMEQIYQLLVYQHAKSILGKNENFDPFIEAALENERKTLYAKYGGSAARTQEEFASRGKTVESEMEQIKRELVTTSFRETYFTPNFTVTRSQMLQYYQKHQNEKYVHDPSIQFQLIDIPFNAFGGASAVESKEQALQAAEAALEQIGQGNDFGEVARAYSHDFQKANGGLWRPVNPQSLKDAYQPVLRALQDLSVNECTGIVEGEGRFFIAKLIDQKLEQRTPFPEVQGEISDEIKQQRWMKYSQELGGKLLKSAAIGNLSQFIKQTAMVAYRQWCD